MHTMNFKISILLLTWSICAESAPPKKDGLEKEYGVAKWRLDVPDERGFNEVEMAHYAGINVTKLRSIANSISIENLDNINLETFKLLLKAIKKRRGNTLREFQIELGVGPCNTPTLDKGLETEYRNAKWRFRVHGERGFNEAEMAEYAGMNVSKLKEIAKTISLENLENINFETFKLLVKAIKIKRNNAIKESPKELGVGPCNTPSLDIRLDNEYSIAKWRLEVPDERGFNEVEMADHAGINVSKLREIANSISIGSLENINLETFELLMKTIRKKRNNTIKEPQIELGVGPCNEPSLDNKSLYNFL